MHASLPNRKRYCRMVGSKVAHDLFNLYPHHDPFQSGSFLCLLSMFITDDGGARKFAAVRQQVSVCQRGCQLLLQTFITLTVHLTLTHICLSVRVVACAMCGRYPHVYDVELAGHAPRKKGKVCHYSTVTVLIGQSSQWHNTRQVYVRTEYDMC